LIDSGETDNQPITNEEEQLITSDEAANLPVTINASVTNEKKLLDGSREDQSLPITTSKLHDAANRPIDEGNIWKFEANQRNKFEKAINSSYGCSYLLQLSRSSPLPPRSSPLDIDATNKYS
jgi:hypothetical protein